MAFPLQFSAVVLDMLERGLIEILPDRRVRITDAGWRYAQEVLKMAPADLDRLRLQCMETKGTH